MSSWGLRGAVRVCLLACMCLWARGYGASLRVLSALSCCCFTTMAALSASSSFFASPLACEARKHWQAASLRLRPSAKATRAHQRQQHGLPMGKGSGGGVCRKYGRRRLAAWEGGHSGPRRPGGNKTCPRVRASYVRVKHSPAGTGPSHVAGCTRGVECGWARSVDGTREGSLLAPCPFRPEPAQASSHSARARPRCARRSYRKLGTRSARIRRS